MYMDSNNKVNGHFLDHVHIFINEDDIVVGRYIFNSCNDQEMIDHVLETTKATKSVSLCSEDHVNHSQIGLDYKYENGLFYSRKPYPSWTKDETFPQWLPPVEKPNETKTLDGKDINYAWNEAKKTWTKFIIEEIDERE